MEEDIESENESVEGEEINEMMEGESPSEFSDEYEMTTLAQLQQSETSIDEEQVEEMTRSGVDFPIIAKEQFVKKSLFSKYAKYVCEEMSGDVTVKNNENQATEVNLINWANIQKHNKDKKI